MAYQRASQDELFYRGDDGQEIAVLDLVGGYGSTLLGHNHPALNATACQFFSSGKVNHAQGSMRSGAAALAEALNDRSGGDYCSLFANSGTEAIEAALKHAMLETGGSTLIALQGAFHGKTLGALQGTANARYREPFAPGGFKVIRVAPNRLEDLEHAFDNVQQPIGFLYEPIQGEAGVRPLDGPFLQRALERCRQAGVPLIADECQTGLGRTGPWLASSSLGVQPDYVVLSKSLGGGLAKISALMIQRKRYREDFELLHSSTFADDEFSCAIARRVLELLDTTAIEQGCARGEYLRQQLQFLRQRYPQVITEVRGRGLMLGVEFARPIASTGFLLKHFSNRELLGTALASYLLNEHRIRVATTLSNSFTLRIQPSLLLTVQQCDRVVAAFSQLCEKLADQDIAHLTQRLAAMPPSDSSAQVPETLRAMLAGPTPCTFREPASVPLTPSRRVAWIFHFVDEFDLSHLDPGLARFTRQQQANLCDRWSALSQPVIMESTEIRSLTGDRVTLQPILLPVTSHWMLRNRNASHLVRSGIDIAEQLGCGVVSLGQFTSIVMRRGKPMPPGGPVLTTGSHFTAALAQQAVSKALCANGLSAHSSTLAIIGAGGEIGCLCAAMMASGFGETILVGSGRVGSHARLSEIATGLARTSVAVHPEAIRQAHVVVAATNSTTRPIGWEYFHREALICDVSVPQTIGPEVIQLLPRSTILPGALIQLPGKETTRIPGFPLPQGITYGCMAEGLLLGLEHTDEWLEGNAINLEESSPEHAARLAALAAKHGFELATGLSYDESLQSAVGTFA